jgi:hypothetical protein
MVCTLSVSSNPGRHWVSNTMVGFRAIAALGVHPGVNRACILTVGSKPSISALVGLFFSPPELCDIIPAAYQALSSSSLSRPQEAIRYQWFQASRHGRSSSNGSSLTADLNSRETVLDELE